MGPVSAVGGRFRVTGSIDGVEGGELAVHVYMHSVYRVYSAIYAGYVLCPV